jgi:TonB family protein
LCPKYALASAYGRGKGTFIFYLWSLSILTFSPMKALLLVFALVGYSALGQTVYKSSEVEKPADPAGGAVALNQFLAANLQIPIRSAARGLNGGVTVKGIVEPDGSMSSLEVVRSIDSLADREALRILGLYRAWQPAILNGKAVRQEATYPVFFRTACLPNFDFATSTIVEYFDKDHRPTADPAAYEYRSVIPVDERGSVRGRGEVSYERNRKGTWKTVTSIPYQKTEEWVLLATDTGPDSVRALRMSAREEDLNSSSETVTVQADGKPLSIVAAIGTGKMPYSSKHYYKSGMLREEMKMVDSTRFLTTWYDNGQLHSITEVNLKKGTAIREVYDRSGNKLVSEGNGWVILRADPLYFRSVYEQGQVTDARKTGRWTGKFADSTLLYEEWYEAGVLKKGNAHVNGRQVAYQNEFMTEAQFPGPDGKMDMYRFLAQNIRYPAESVRTNVTGRVLITFLVHEDGHSSDYRIEYSADKRLETEALRVVKLTNGKWQPAQFKGRPVQSRFSLPIGFNVESSGVNVRTYGVPR